MDEYYSTLDRVFSSASSVYDKKILSNFINVNIREMELSALIEFSRDSDRILEVGCGTGEEASRFIRSAHKNLICIDAAMGMVEYSTEKMRTLGISEKFSALKLPAYRVGELNMIFDLVYSLNGALNTEPRLDVFVRALEKILPEGGIIIISLRNRLCIGEFLLYSVLGRHEPLKRRKARSTPVQVVGNTIESFYYSPEEICRVFSNFVLRKKVGLGILVPPYLADRFRSNLIRRIITATERLISRIPILSSLGDEVLYVFEKR